MAFASSFPQSNGILDPTDPEHDPVSVYFEKQGDDSLFRVVACYKFTREELDEINRTGRVWISFKTAPVPVFSLDGISPFKEKFDEVSGEHA